MRTDKRKQRITIKKKTKILSQFFSHFFLNKIYEFDIKDINSTKKHIKYQEKFVRSFKWIEKAFKFFKQTEKIDSILFQFQ